MRRRLLLLPLFALACLVFIANTATADITVDYGTDEGGTLYIDLQAEQANQVVQLFGLGIGAEGGTDGLEFDVQVGDGGAFLGGTDTAPTITSIDLITGTIWESLGPNQVDQEVHPLVRQSTVDTSSLANSDGLIATIVFDTTGFGTGEIDFLLTDVAGGAASTTFFRGSTILGTIAPNGIIRVNPVPEPSSAVLIGLGLVGLVARRRRSS